MWAKMLGKRFWFLSNAFARTRPRTKAPRTSAREPKPMCARPNKTDDMTAPVRFTRKPRKKISSAGTATSRTYARKNGREEMPLMASSTFSRSFRPANSRPNESAEENSSNASTRKSAWKTAFFEISGFKQRSARNAFTESMRRGFSFLEAQMKAYGNRTSEMSRAKKSGSGIQNNPAEKKLIMAAFH